MDWLAIVSHGTYPTPTPTASERAAYAISYGLLGIITIKKKAKKSKFLYQLMYFYKIRNKWEPDIWHSDLE